MTSHKKTEFLNWANKKAIESRKSNKSLSGRSPNEIIIPWDKIKLKVSSNKLNDSSYDLLTQIHSDFLKIKIERHQIEPGRFKNMISIVDFINFCNKYKINEPFMDYDIVKIISIGNYNKFIKKGSYYISFNEIELKFKNLIDNQSRSD